MHELVEVMNLNIWKTMQFFLVAFTVYVPFRSVHQKFKKIKRAHERSRRKKYVPLECVYFVNISF